MIVFIKSFRYLFIFSFVLISGCSKVDTVKPNTKIINTIPSSKKIFTKDHNTERINSVKGKGSFLKAYVDVENQSNRFNNIEYRFRWYDDYMNELSEPIWKPLFLNPLDNKRVTGTSSTTKAKKFRFSIRETK